jgi:antitoxin PrlF
MLESTITEKGQTTVPKEIREILGVTSGQRIQWNLAENGTVTVRPEPSALSLYGSLISPKKFPGNRKEKAAVRKHIAAHYGSKRTLRPR